MASQTKRKRTKNYRSGHKKKQRKYNPSGCICQKQAIIGEMWNCNKCHRSFHKKCIGMDPNENETECLLCDMSDDDTIGSYIDNTLEEELMEIDKQLSLIINSVQKQTDINDKNNLIKAQKLNQNAK